MSRLTIKGVLDVLKLAAECESLMAELYRNAAGMWPEEKKFWEDIAVQEEKHAGHVRKMMELVSRNPEEYRPGRPITSETVETLTRRIQEVIEGLKKRSVSRSAFRMLVRDFEQRVIESSYSQIVITENPVFKQLAKEIIAESSEHKAVLDAGPLT